MPPLEVVSCSRKFPVRGGVHKIVDAAHLGGGIILHCSIAVTENVQSFSRQVVFGVPTGKVVS